MDKEKDLLQQIANTLLINIQYVKQYGLSQGKLGIAVFFYYYSRYTGNERYSDFSDEYLEFILKKLNKDFSENFADGLGGIGWIIDRLIKEGFLEADDDILEEVDESWGKMGVFDFVKEMDLHLSMFSKGLYFLQRDNQNVIREIISQIDDFLKTIPETRTTLLYLNSMIYFILISIRREIETETCHKILDKIFEIIKRDYSGSRFSNLEAALYEKNLSLMNCDDTARWEQLMLPVLSEIEDLDKTYAECYIDFLFPQGKKLGQIPKTLYQSLSNATRQSNYDNLTIYNGLAGIGLSLLKSCCND
jgi:lantibiotic modifying enzyme